MKKPMMLITLFFSVSFAMANATEKTASASPESTVIKYYQWYLNCMDKAPDNQCYFYKPSPDYVSKTLLDKLYKKKEIDYDYFLKAQDIDTRIAKKTLKATVATKANTHSVQVNLYLKLFDEASPDGVRNLKVLMEKSGNAWKIYKVLDQNNQE